MSKWKKMFICLTQLNMPILKKTVLFSAFYGQYNDNPKYISLLLHDLHPEWKQVWVHSSKSREEFPEYVEVVEFGSPQYYKYVCRSQVVVDNHVGLRATFFVKSDKLQRFISYVFAKKRIGQLNISTWHGTPLKRIALDEPGKREVCDFYTNTNYILSGCDMTKNALESGYANKIPVKSYGTPRNDILVSKKFEIEKLKKKLGLPLDKRIILFAPTFRETLEYSGLKQMHEFRFEELLDSLNKKFGGKWVFVFRVHNVVLKQINFENEINDQIYNGNIGDDMAEYLACSDALITDYSGAMFDFALTQKPVFLYVPDLENYMNFERGFYMDFSSLPFPRAEVYEDLISEIQRFNSKIYVQKIDQFMKLKNYIEDGKASDRVVEDIEKFICSIKR